MCLQLLSQWTDWRVFPGAGRDTWVVMYGHKKTTITVKVLFFFLLAYLFWILLDQFRLKTSLFQRSGKHPFPLKYNLEEGIAIQIS